VHWKSLGNGANLGKLQQIAGKIMVDYDEKKTEDLLVTIFFILFGAAEISAIFISGGVVLAFFLLALSLLGIAAWLIGKKRTSYQIKDVHIHE
jgi:hypothetical protein